MGKCFPGLWNRFFPYLCPKFLKMNFLDIVLLLPLVYGLYVGFSKGLIKQLTGLVGVVLALLFSIKISGFVSQFLINNDMVNEGWASVAGFAIAFLAILIAVRLAGALVKKTTDTIGLGIVEQILGGAFGALKAFLIVLVLLFFFVKINTFLNIVPTEILTESKLFPYYEMGFEYLAQFWQMNNNTELTQ